MQYRLISVNETITSRSTMKTMCWLLHRKVFIWLLKFQIVPSMVDQQCRFKWAMIVWSIVWLWYSASSDARGAFSESLHNWKEHEKRQAMKMILFSLMESMAHLAAVFVTKPTFSAHASEYSEVNEPWAIFSPYSLQSNLCVAKICTAIPRPRYFLQTERPSSANISSTP